ncbi:Glucose/arabinose dehydrogenase, beta-propeller fold [Rubritalea squalenifaciens DSM 18772]|uniref:Glucose/arabinose dehydrogenase, beta-propeller fold n=1 Tax=Rubritalea squalenifaciens DSM 18772 TaxID=1123071 RepID=A0A1M6QJY2_9BACT|nr:c-type cytochrome [Rubritalea squalenifaciens]SHK20541.1 Glucose/arabinose dehydrogenase, beta-propeller fold [Rubritalea squalenifaciens DSM 18772]
MISRYSIHRLLLAAGLSCGILQAAEPVNPNRQADGTLKPLSAEEGLKLIEVPEGYRIELVASEPMVQEPVCFTFDADGALFVCEWNTYMQDQYGTGQDKAVCRVVKLVDTDGDGKMDKRTVFADGLMMPRSILALHDRILVRMSHDSTIWSFFDEDKDGVSERREMAYKGTRVGGNIEHQDNSLVWNADNRIYATGQIYRYQDGKLTPQKGSGRYGQWGLARDDVGGIYGSGNSVPVSSWSLLGGYPMLNPPKDQSVFYANFLCDVDDATDPGHNVTATGGQTMIRSAQLGKWYGHYVIPDPVRRMVKMVKFEEKNGQRVATVPEEFKKSEFVRSPDTYFRPVWLEMGPDGGLYIADMSRGIIQESQWFPTERTENPKQRWIERYYRTKEWDMLGVNSRGRIYRVIPEDASQLDVQPKLANQSSVELVQYFSHANAWWRDTAHKLIVCRGDRSVVPALVEKLDAPEPMARLLALRSLEAFDALEPGQVTQALRDKDARVRTTAIAITEKMVAKHPALVDALQPLADDASSIVLCQLYLSLGNMRESRAQMLRKVLLAKHAKHEGLAAMVKKSQSLPRHLQKYTAGYKAYSGFCGDCHGDGEKGLLTDGKLMAPVFSNNKRIKDPEYLVNVIMKGMMGPLGEQKEEYAAGLMPPLESMYDDKQLTELANYIGMRWGGWKQPLKQEEVAGWRKKYQDRKTPWTYQEIIKAN